MSIGRAFLLWIVGFLVLTLVLTSAMTLRSVRATLEAELRHQAEMMARSIAAEVAQGEIPERIPVAAMRDVRAAEVRDLKGRLLWALGPALDQVRSLDSGLVEIRQRVSLRSDLDTIDGVNDAGAVVDVVLLVSPARIEREVATSAARLAIGLSMGLGLALLVGLALVGRIVRPLRRLAEEVRHFHPEVRPELEMPAGTATEIQSLARAFAEMAERLRLQRQALATSEQRYREVFETTPTPLLELDAELRVVGANPAAEPFLEIGPDAALPAEGSRGVGHRAQSASLQPPDRVGSSPGERLSDRLVGHDPEVLRQAAAAALEGDEVALESRWRLASSGRSTVAETAEVEVHLRRLDGDGPARLLMAVHDQTDRVRRLGERWRRTFEAMVDGVGLVDADGTIRLANPALEPYEEAIAADVLRRAVEQSDAEWQSRAGDRLLQCALRAPEGLEHRILVVRDVTEAAEAEARLREAQKMAAVATLASGVAHDFNNLLAGILLHARLILHSGGAVATSSDRPAAEAITEAATAINDLAVQGEEVVQELLLFARRETTPHHPLDLGALIREQAGLLQHLLPASIGLELGVPARPVLVEGSPVALRRVVLNLVLNARDAVIARAPGTAEPGQVWVGVAATREWATLEVRDNGRGMSAEEQERLFEPFYSSRREGRGAGLGLAVVYAVVSEHGGRTSVRSEPRVGTSVSVRLPLAGTSPRGVIADRPEPPAAEQAPARQAAAEQAPAEQAPAEQAAAEQTAAEQAAAEQAVAEVGVAEAAEPGCPEVALDVVGPEAQDADTGPPDAGVAVFAGEPVLVIEPDGRAAAELVGQLTCHGLNVRHARSPAEARRLVASWAVQAVVVGEGPAEAGDRQDLERLAAELDRPVLIGSSSSPDELLEALRRTLATGRPE